MAALRHPSFALLVTAAAAAIVAMLPLRIPLGANFWDLYFHLDAAWRIASGQTPHVDFFSPAGPLPFYALSVMERQFSGAPLLLAQYGVAIPALLTMAVVVLRLGERVRPLGWLLALVFALFALLPFNASSFFPAPGADAIGLYNRQCGLLLTAFFAALLLMRAGMLRGLLLGVLLSMLFLTKINGFAVALAAGLFAILSGRLGWRDAAIAGGLLVAALAAVEAANGMISAYMADLAAMLGQNSGGAGARLMTLLSVKFDVALPMALLALLIVVADAGRVAGAFTGGISMMRAALRLPSVEFTAAALLVTVYESQNTGGQEFLPLFPAMLPLLASTLAMAAGLRRMALLVLMAAATLPTFLNVVQAGARTVIAGAFYRPVAAPGTEAAGLYSTKPDYLRRAEVMLAQYAAERPAYARLAEQGEMPEAILYSSPDYQALHLMDIANAATALRGWEAQSGRTLSTLYTLDANDLMPRLLSRAPVKGVTISFDPSRGYPRSEHPAFVAALSGAEGILAPHCPETPARRMILAIAAPALEPRERIALTPCWDLYLKR